jgi:hypothetical protein
MRHLFLIFFLITTFACSNNDSIVTSSFIEEPTQEELRAAMRFHGILVAKQDENYEWYFIRDGKRCPLFAYLKRPDNKLSNPPENNS